MSSYSNPRKAITLFSINRFNTEEGVANRKHTLIQYSKIKRRSYTDLSPEIDSTIYLPVAGPGAARLGITLTFLASTDLTLTTLAWIPQEMQ
jgi:hypothetical protein